MILKDKIPELSSSNEDFELAISEFKQDKYILKLYISGITYRSTMAISNLKKICEEYLEGRYELEVYDIHQMPNLAKEEQIIAVPTLIKKMPFPIRRIVGDLSNREKVLFGLNLKEIKHI